MKSLAIDSVSPQITVAAQNDTISASMTLNAGIHQSEYLLTTIDAVLSQAKLKPKDLEFTACCMGPGSFTSLRLAYSALKAFETATNAPIYAIDTLEAYAADFAQFDGVVASVLDARRDRFYVSLYENGALIEGPLDIGIEEISEKLSRKERILAVGPGSELFLKKLTDFSPEKKVFSVPLSYNCANTLLKLAEAKHLAGEKSVQPFEGPFYIRNEHGD